MFRVPINELEPTFDDTFKVSFWRWLTSSRRDRRKWMARRNRAAKLAETNQNAQARIWADEKRRKHEAD